VWLIVRDANARARKVYRNLGFERFDPPPGERKIYDAIAEPPGEGAYRMRLRRIVLRF
jgi:ribosomal protein S18 acetylase RimI-like enzyme